MGAANQTAQINGFTVGTASSHAKVCPSCGHCPTCGRHKPSPYPAWPYWQWQYPPYYSNGLTLQSNGTYTQGLSEVGSASAASQPSGAINLRMTTG